VTAKRRFFIVVFIADVTISRFYPKVSPPYLLVLLRMKLPRLPRLPRLPGLLLSTISFSRRD
jgi:hypothetical protein